MSTNTRPFKGTAGARRREDDEGYPGGAVLDDPEEPATASCPNCDEENAPMGALGRSCHFRCRACGWVYSQAR